VLLDLKKKKGSRKVYDRGSKKKGVGAHMLTIGLSGEGLSDIKKGVSLKIEYNEKNNHWDGVEGEKERVAGSEGKR